MKRRCMIIMGRLKELRAYVNAELNKMEDEDKRTGAIVHLYGVSLAATMIAKKRGLDWEIASIDRKSTRLNSSHL